MSQGVSQDCLAALADHLAEPTEGSLSRAYEFGRQALSADFGILDVLSLYEAAFREVVLPAPAAERPRVASAVADFFRELLVPFEMSFRGYREANKVLHRVNDELASVNSELRTKQAQLVQAAKMASLGELVAGIAHEINNPLAFVLSHLRTAERSLMSVESEVGKFLTAPDKEALERARNRVREGGLGAQRIQNLVIKLRTFSRLDEGHHKTVSIRESIHSVLAILEHRFKDRIDLQTKFGEPDMVRCFPDLLNQAVMNLVANAIDAIPAHGTIWIETGSDADDCIISVSDSGGGIPEHLLDRVLEPFFTTKPVGAGTGLGLSITHSIAQRHGGTLQLTPRDAGGMVAVIRFPLEPDAP